MKILILDPEKNVSHRLSKDTNGGYGTGNDFGDSLIPKILKKTLKKIHDWPAMFAIYSMSVLKQQGHEVIYSKIIPKNLSDFDDPIIERCGCKPIWINSSTFNSLHISEILGSIAGSFPSWNHFL